MVCHFSSHALCAIAAILVAIPGTALAIGSTPVTVVNPADIAKAEGIQHPYQAGVSCSDTGIGIRCTGFIGMPAHQRVVIEYVSASCLIDNTRQALRSVNLSTSANSVGITHFLNIIDRFGVQGDSGTAINQVDVGQTVRLYADPGSQIEVLAATNATTSFAGYPNCEFSLSGQAIDVP